MQPRKALVLVLVLSTPTAALANDVIFDGHTMQCCFHDATFGPSNQWTCQSVDGVVTGVLALSVCGGETLPPKTREDSDPGSGRAGPGPARMQERLRQISRRILGEAAVASGQLVKAVSGHAGYYQDPKTSKQYHVLDDLRIMEVSGLGERPCCSTPLASQ